MNLRTPKILKLPERETKRHCFSRKYCEIEIQLKKENCEWELKGDSLEEPTLSLPEEIILLIEMMKQQKSFDGGNTELAEKFNSFSGKNISVKTLFQPYFRISL